MNKIKRLVITSVVAFLVVIGIGGTAQAARTDMLDVSDHNNNGQALTTQQYINLRNNYGIKAVTVKLSEGKTWNASTARANISDANQAGLYTNGYHFARYNSVATAQAEARHAVQQAQVDGLGVGSVVGIAIIAIFILLGLGFGGHHLYLNHRSEQRTADIGQTIANKDFGKGEVQVYYSKKKNVFTVKPISTTKASIEEYGYDDDNQEEIDTINSNYKNFIKDINKHMGSNYKDYRSFLTNPWNSNRYFIASTGTKETYNILHD